MRKKERDYTWTRPGMRACVEKRLRELIVRPDGRLFDDDEVVSTIKEQLVQGLLSAHAIAEGVNNVGCVKIDNQTGSIVGGKGMLVLTIAVFLMFSYISASYLVIVKELPKERYSQTVGLWGALSVISLMCVSEFARMMCACYKKTHFAFFHYTTAVDNERDACDVLRERLLALADDESREGNDTAAEQVRRLANSDFSSFSEIHFPSSKPALVKGVMMHGVSAVEIKQQGGGGGAGGEVALDVGMGEESMSLLGKPKSQSCARACYVM